MKVYKPARVKAQHDNTLFLEVEDYGMKMLVLPHSVGDLRGREVIAVMRGIQVVELREWRG